METSPAGTAAPWPVVARFVWISGGLVAVNEPGESVSVHAGLNGKLVLGLSIARFGDLYWLLRQQGFLLLGTTFVTSAEEIDGLRPPEFRATGMDGGWPTSDYAQLFRQIAHAAAKDGNMPGMHLAARVAAGLRSAEMGLGELASAYSLQLRARLNGREPEIYQKFSDMNSSRVYKAIHSLFWELAVLRDALAEFAASLCFSIKGVRSMRSLRGQLAALASTDALAKTILQSTDETARGWLSTFTLYRNFFTHVAPMDEAMGSAFSVQDFRSISCGIVVPQIYYALPGDIGSLTKERSERGFYSSLEELRTATARKKDRATEPDALEYLHACLNRFAVLSQLLIDRSPIPPQPIHIGPGDIIGKIRVTRR